MISEDAQAHERIAARLKDLRDEVNRAPSSDWNAPKLKFLLGRFDAQAERIVQLEAEVAEERRQREAAENEIWEDVLRSVQRAWPEPKDYSDCPTELITALIDERDDLLAKLAQATQAPAWHSIETAPDGPVRLQWEGTTVTAIGRRYPDGYNLRNTKGIWRDVEGNHLLTLPTHWAVLSASPHEDRKAD